MPLKIEGQLFTISDVELSEPAKNRAEELQRPYGRTGDPAVSVHSALLLKLHATGQHGNIGPGDRRQNRNSIQSGIGTVLSIIGIKKAFVIITELPTGKTLITTLEEAKG
jgi:hypothetical protein